MRICTKLILLLFVALLAFSTESCQSSHGAYGNTKHNNASSHKKKKSNSKKKKPSSSDKSPDTKSAPSISEGEKPAETPKKEEEKEPSKIGFGANLGALQFAGNQFQFGLTPNIAYKLAEPFAVGFMLKLDYYYFKENLNGQNLTYSSFGLGPTVFTRWKPFWNAENITPFMQGLFLQGEYEHATISQPFDEFGNISTNGNKIVGVRRWEDYLYIGIGSSTGYPSASIFSIHYNLLDDINHSRVPWNWRIGFTWNY